MTINTGTLGYLKDHGYAVVAHCLDCPHYDIVPMDALIERFGDGFNLVADRNGDNTMLKTLRCAKCKSKNVTMQLRPIRSGPPI